MNIAFLFLFSLFGAASACDNERKDTYLFTDVMAIKSRYPDAHEAVYAYDGTQFPTFFQSHEFAPDSVDFFPTVAIGRNTLLEIDVTGMEGVIVFDVFVNSYLEDYECFVHELLAESVTGVETIIRRVDPGYYANGYNRIYFDLAEIAISTGEAVAKMKILHVSINAIDEEYQSMLYISNVFYALQFDCPGQSGIHIFPVSGVTVTDGEGVLEISDFISECEEVDSVAEFIRLEDEQAIMLDLPEKVLAMENPVIRIDILNIEIPTLFVKTEDGDVMFAFEFENSCDSMGWFGFEFVLNEYPSSTKLVLGSNGSEHGNYKGGTMYIQRLMTVTDTGIGNFQVVNVHDFNLRLGDGMIQNINFVDEALIAGDEHTIGLWYQTTNPECHWYVPSAAALSSDPGSYSTSPDVTDNTYTLFSSSARQSYLFQNIHHCPEEGESNAWQVHIGSEKMSSLWWHEFDLPTFVKSGGDFVLEFSTFHVDNDGDSGFDLLMLDSDGQIRSRRSVDIGEGEDDHTGQYILQFFISEEIASQVSFVRLQSQKVGSGDDPDDTFWAISPLVRFNLINPPPTCSGHTCTLGTLKAGAAAIEGETDELCCDFCSAATCGLYDPDRSCQCDRACDQENHDDCCDNFVDACNTCAGRCNTHFDKDRQCQCDAHCTKHGDCCEDFAEICTTCGDLGCGAYDPGNFCQCDEGCSGENDCCDDYVQQCESCQGHCFDDHDEARPCQCDHKCEAERDCCEDFSLVCETCVDNCEMAGDDLSDDSRSCFCDPECVKNGDCCDDFEDVCVRRSFRDRDDSLITLGDSCAAGCAAYDERRTCQCDPPCDTEGDCCDDALPKCSSCENKCGVFDARERDCQCDDECEANSDCCYDFAKCE